MTTLAQNALTTLAVAADALGITPGDSAVVDARLTRYINIGSSLFERACFRRFFHAEDHVERVKGFGDGVIKVVDHLPIIEVTSIAYEDGQTSTPIDDSAWSLKGEKEKRKGFIHGAWADTRLRRTDISTHPVIGTAEPNYVVTYTGGYVTPAQAEADVELERTLPWEIEEAVVEFVAMKNAQRGQDPTIGGVSMDDGSISYLRMGTERVAVPPSFKSAVISYMRRVVG